MNNNQNVAVQEVLRAQGIVSNPAGVTPSAEDLSAAAQVSAVIEAIGSTPAPTPTQELEVSAIAPTENKIELDRISSFIKNGTLLRHCLDNSRLDEINVSNNNYMNRVIKNTIAQFYGAYGSTRIREHVKAFLDSVSKGVTLIEIDPEKIMITKHDGKVCENLFTRMFFSEEKTTISSINTVTDFTDETVEKIAKALPFRI